MPCSDGYAEHFRRIEIEKVVRRLNKVTRLLCGLCKRLDTRVINKDKQLAKWWGAHQKRDAKKKIKKGRDG